MGGNKGALFFLMDKGLGILGILGHPRWMFENDNEIDPHFALFL